MRPSAPWIAACCWLCGSLACVTPPRNAPPPQPLFGSPASGAVGPPRVAEPPLPPDAFDDAATRAARVREALPALDAHFAALQQREQMPGLAVALVVDGDIVWSKGYGQRDDAGAPVDGDTVFRVGSITKVVTAMAVLALRDAGKLALDDPAAKYLPALSGLIYPSSDAAPITIRQLLSHDAGLPRNDAHAPGPRAPSREQVERGYDGMRLERAPGLGPRYSNIGVGTLALIIQAAAGQPYRDVVRTRILEPLGLRSAAWDAADVPAAALALAHAADGSAIAAEQHWRLGPTEADGGLYLSAHDLAKLVAWQLDAWPPRSDRDTGPLRRASIRESHQMKVFEGVRGRVKDGEVRTSARGTGFAWQVEQSCKLEHLVWHNGGTEGYRAAAFMLPQRGVGLVALVNGKAAPDAGTVEALHLLVDAARLAPRTPRPAPRLDEALAAVAALVEKGNINEPDYLALFADGFRRQVPLATLRELASSLRAKHGLCRQPRWIDVDSPYAGRARFRCEDGSERDAMIALDHHTPQRIHTLLLQPPQPPAEDRARCP